MKKSFIVCVLALCLLSGLLAPAHAEYYAQVFNTESLNIRSGPGIEYPWLGSIPRDGQVRVISESNGWYQIVTLDGSITGYMSKNYLMPVSSPSYEEYQAPASSVLGYATVTGTDSLNVRTGPGTEHSWIGSIARGETVLVNGSIGNWYLVFVPSKGLNGYVSANFISIGGAQSPYGGTQPVTGGTTAYVSNPAGTRFLNLREYPSYDSNILDIFYNGETCTVLNRQQDGWVYVSAVKNGVCLYGYFRGEYLSSYPVSSSQISPAQGSPIVTATVNTRLNGGNGKSLNLRSEPSLNAGILLHIPNGSTLQVYRKGSIWWQVSYNGVVGYVDSSFIGSGYTPAQPTAGNAYVRTGNGGKLNLREQANANSRVLGQYENGTAVNVIQRGTTWCYVQVGGQSGYMMTQYLSITGGGSSATRVVVNTNGGSYVNLRTSPDKNNNVNMRVPVGSTVTVLSWGQEWAQVSYGGVSGFCIVKCIFFCYNVFVVFCPISKTAGEIHKTAQSNDNKEMERSMKLGVVGLPNVGKSTLFNAITNAGAQAANYPFCTIEPNSGVVAVPDARLDVLAAMYNPKKVTPASVEFVDIAGLVKGASHGEGLGNKFLSHIRECDAIVHVVRCFEDDNIIHVDGSVDPARDIETINLELIFADMETVEKRRDKASKLVKTGDKKYAAEAETADKVYSHLEAGKPARTCDLSEEEREIVNGWFLLTAKPVIYAANIAEDAIADADANPMAAAVKKIAAGENAECVTISAAIEEEIAGMEPDERQMFLDELGIRQSGLDALITACYHLLGLISFLTAGADECRAWTIKRGTKAPQAAGKIHTDFERGFIRAEIVPFETLKELGSMNACKEKGLVRSEGKDYVMQDGDVTLFRFNV